MKYLFSVEIMQYGIYLSEEFTVSGLFLQAFL